MREDKYPTLGTPTHYPYEMLVACFDVKPRRIIYDERVDIWCLGIILYSLLYKGFTPFETEPFDRDETKKRIRQLQYTFPHEKDYENHLPNDLIKKILVHPNDRLSLD